MLRLLCFFLPQCWLLLYSVSRIFTLKRLNICFTRPFLPCFMNLNFNRPKKMNKSRKVNIHKMHYVQLWCSYFPSWIHWEWFSEPIRTLSRTASTKKIWITNSYPAEYYAWNFYSPTFYVYKRTHFPVFTAKWKKWDFDKSKKIRF